MCTRAVWFSSRMVSTMPSTVMGLTNEDAPSTAEVPSGQFQAQRRVHAAVLGVHGAPATATVLPSRAVAAAD